MLHVSIASTFLWQGTLTYFPAWNMVSVLANVSNWVSESTIENPIPCSVCVSNPEAFCFMFCKIEVHRMWSLHVSVFSIPMTFLIICFLKSFYYGEFGLVAQTYILYPTADVFR